MFGAVDDLVVLPRTEYEELIASSVLPKKYKEFTPTKAQTKALRQAERNFKAGKLLTYEQFGRKLGIIS